MGLLDFVGLLLGPDSSYDRVTMLKQDIENMGSNEATATYRYVNFVAIVG
jgi:hypothetical protein